MVANTNHDGLRLSKRVKGKVVSYFQLPLQNQSSNQHNLDYNDGRHSLDSDRNDYVELREALLEKRGLTGARLQIQMFNFNNLRLLQLPTEVLLQIFKYLDKSDLFLLLTVCREFSDLIVEILWFRPNMQSDLAFQKIREIMKLPRLQTHWDYRSYIKRLNLLFMTKLVDDELLYLFCGCPKLERLTLVNCTKLTHAPIAEVLKNCEHLQSIDMTGVQDIQNDIFFALAKHCTRLQGLYAPGCGNILEDAIVQVLKACPMLKRIKFNNSENVTNTSILTMYENCRLLVEIDLHNCPKVTDKYLKGIFSELTQLREFRISNAPGITDELFKLIPDDHFLDKLRIIDVTGCNAITDKLIERMVRCAPRLRNVVLSKCMQITDASLRHLTKLGRSLHYIHLGHCALITDFGVQALVRSCHRIQYIDLACCSQLTDWTLTELLALPKLRRIGLVKCNLISDQGILELVRRRGDQDCLERVHLSYCTNLTIGPIYFLLKSCPRLTHLSLTGISAFLRREITQYCRDPPPDFTENQKSSFCVFSGHGVVQLRNHLDTLMDQRAYILEHYGQQEDFSPAYFERRMREARLTPAPGEPTQYPTPEQLNQLRMAGPGVLGTPGPVNEFAGAGDGRNIINDDEMTTWAAQRGLGELRRVRDPATRESPGRDGNRQGTPRRDTPFIMPDPFRRVELDAIIQQLVNADQNRQRFGALYHPLNSQLDAVEQRIRENQMNLQTDASEEQEGPRNVDVRLGNAPHIAQAPVFGNDEPMNGEDDSEMEGVDLFPRIR